MEYCSDSHNLIYKIQYKAVTPNAHPNEWLVCENCYQNHDVFKDEDTILSMTMINGEKITNN